LVTAPLSSNGTLHLLFAEYADAFGFVTPFIRYQRSTDEGQTWSSPLTLSGPPPGIGASQPRLAIPAPGVVLATWLQDPGNGALEIRWRRSADAGMSFGPEGTAAQPAGLGGGYPAGVFWSYSLTAERRPNALAAGRAVIFAKT